MDWDVNGNVKAAANFPGRRKTQPLVVKTNNVEGGTSSVNARRVFALVALALALMAPAIPQAAAQTIDQDFFYKLSTQFRGTGLKLDTFSGGPKDSLTRLAPNSNAPSQNWQLRKNTDGTFRLSTRLAGRDWCLDVFNGGPNNNQPHLANCANFSGQFWRLTQSADGTYRLSTLFRGPGMCLDIFNGGPNNNQPHLADCANFSGQLWILTKTNTRASVTID